MSVCQQAGFEQYFNKIVTFLERTHRSPATKIVSKLCFTSGNRVIFVSLRVLGGNENNTIPEVQHGYFWRQSHRLGPRVEREEGVVF